VRKRGVHVVTVYPGPIRTAMAEAAVARYAEDPMAALPVGSAEGLAQLVLRAVRRRQPRVVYPRRYAVARMLPSLASWAVGRYSPMPKSAER
jgi:short-subunit dehydrogenase